MMLHTIMPLDAVWEEGFTPVQTAEVRLQGILMEVKPLDAGRAEIVRLLDCPLESYLKPAFAPGQVIRYIPTL
ncbi:MULTISPECIES: YlzJ-like family protein [unclassified Paenibacillus]|uniref:YlzJ-like family protein n=1 Tax=unclassified Paenibacillus TaxID=185978 RepID=UPI000CF8D27F|nr:MULTISPECIES: YlzJ-like family protein [unclassified Paenibacillus]MBJ9990273.1 YlzJ-like family protein [Paenibacillus sp. S28]PQP89561.1 hypothetical protein CPT76_16160 [Paenibacillus sp. AR247]